MECGCLGIRKARLVTVKQLLLYSFKYFNKGPTAKFVTVGDYEFTSECKFKTIKSHFHIYLETFKQQWK
jgi:hypothetical protein